MPWRIETNNEECRSGYAVVKESDGSLAGCHTTRREAVAQIAALNISENYDRALPNNYRPALSRDVPDGRACGNCRYYDETRVREDGDDLLAYCTKWDAYVNGAYYCNAWKGHEEEHDDDEYEEDEYRADAPAPPEDQIEGSSKNEPGSASGQTGDIALTEQTEQALQTKADDHNQAMSEANRPSWTRVRVGALRSVYRRGSGAYSTSHRPGIGRAQWSMARVNAFLYLARTGRPQNPRYVGDNDLLNSEHPRYTKSEARAEGYPPTNAMVAEARRGLEWRRLYNRGGTEVGVARASSIVNRKNLSRETIGRMVSFFARHEVDKQGQGFSIGEPGYPSAGRIAWALWGGDPGKAFAEKILDELKSTTSE